MRVISLLAAAAALAACGEGAATGGTGPSARPASEKGAGPVQPDAAVRPEIREFREWRAVCDNANACVAWTGSSEGGWLHIGLEAGPGSVPTVTGGGWGFDGSDGEPADLRLTVDGRDFALRVGPENAANAAAADARNRQIITALAAGRSLVLTAGDQSIALPAAGASAALLWIDERQGRLDTTTALLRRGDRPASSMPAAPKVPVVRPAPPMPQGEFQGANAPGGEDPPAGLRVPAAIEALDEVKACREESNEYLDKAVLAARLDGSTVLWGIPCGSGAYNATYVLYLARPDGSGVRPAPLPRREPRTAEEGDLWLVNPQYDAAEQTLTVFPRGRGLGDCGMITTWTWTAQGFALTTERFMGDCWSMPWVLWPTTWQTARG